MKVCAKYGCRREVTGGTGAKYCIDHSQTQEATEFKKKNLKSQHRKGFTWDNQDVVV